jgi:hypothetical protein
LPDNLPSHKWLGYYRKLSLLTELDSFTLPFLQICQSYGLRRLRVLRATKNSTANSTHGSGATPMLPNFVPFQHIIVFFETHWGKSPSFPFKGFAVTFKGFAETSKGHTGKSKGHIATGKGRGTPFKGFIENSKGLKEKSKGRSVTFKGRVATGKGFVATFKGRGPAFKGKQRIRTWLRWRYF